MDPITVITKNCVGCSLCVKACPYDAIFVFRKDVVPPWLKGKEAA